jgi:NADH-quinone oxidoreductase subunit C
VTPSWFDPLAAPHAQFDKLGHLTRPFSILKGGYVVYESAGKEKQKFGDQITGANFEALDPWIEVSPAGLVALCKYLRDEPDLRFDFLSLISGVDYFEGDPKKAAKVTWKPHFEVVYHLWSVPHRVTLVLKVILPRWKDDVPGEIPEVPSVSGKSLVIVGFDDEKGEVYDPLRRPLDTPNSAESSARKTGSGTHCAQRL